MFSRLCLPALIYVVFAMSHIIIDTMKGHFSTAFLKVWIMLLFGLLLDLLCKRGMTVLSWFIVFVPFFFMSTIAGVLLYVFGLDPATGEVVYNNKNGESYRGGLPVK